MWPPKAILHPTDFSECSKAGFKLACDLAEMSHAKVIVLHVFVPAVRAPNEFPLPEMELESKEEAQRQLNMILPFSANVPVEHRFVKGSAAEVILDVAKQTKVDLIVMGTLGRSGLKRLLLGSVTEHVQRHAPCPVLTTKPGEKETLKKTKRT